MAVLLLLAMSSLGVYGIVLGGYSAQSPYSLLGALRSSAQMISYEIAMGLSFVPVFLYAGSLSTSQIVAAQINGPEFHLFGAIWHWPSWFAILLLPSFVIYLITMVGETNRIPFDLPEGEGELVGGYHTEYSSLKFAMLQLAEYVSVITVSALATTMFLGGWRAPWPISVWSGANSGWWPVLWFLGKVLTFIFVFFWLRSALPRVRYDQLMKLGWKVLIPSALAWTLVVATARVYRRQGGSPAVYIVAGLIVDGPAGADVAAGSPPVSARSGWRPRPKPTARRPVRSLPQGPRSRLRLWIFRTTTALAWPAPASPCWPV